jgi:hypothetical protein
MPNPVTRTRTRWKPGYTFSTGTFYRADAAEPKTLSLTKQIGTFTTCNDTVGNWTKDWQAVLSNPRSRKAQRKIYLANALELKHDYVRHGWFTAVKNPGTSVEYRWSKYPALNPGTPASAYGTWNLPLPSTKYNDILAGANISTPAVSIPSFLGELPELPTAFRNFGRKQLANDGLAKHAAAVNLGWRWGIAPLWNDFNTFVAGIDDINARLEKLRRLRTDEFYSSTVNLSRGSYTGPTTYNNWLYYSNGLLVSSDSVTNYSYKEWGSAQYYVRFNTVLPPVLQEHNVDPLTWHLPVTDGLWAQQRRLGLTPYEALAAAWELLPWSWLADWFFGVSAFINASRNELNLGVRNVCLMRKFRSETVHTINRTYSSPQLGFCLPPLTTQTLKTRYPLSGQSSVLSTEPFFSPAKWGIIASLLALASKKPLDTGIPLNLVRIGLTGQYSRRKKKK